MRKKRSPYRSSWLVGFKRIWWNRGLKLAWYRLWVRSDEFHRSLNIDPEALAGAKSGWRLWYQSDLAHRRKLAHRRDLARERAAHPGLV